RAHPPKSAHFAYQLPLFLPIASPRLEPLSNFRRVHQQSILFNCFERRQRRNTTKRIAAKCPAESSHSRRVYHFCTTGNSRKRHSASERFRAHQQIRFDSEMLARKPFSRARNSRLHFVCNK